MQSESDLEIVANLLDSGNPRTYCHTIAKCQQAVAEGVKSLVAALRDAGILNIEIGYRHQVARFMTVLIHMPQAARYHSLQARIHRLLDIKTRREIDALDRLAPHRPPPGGHPSRNTEYPYQQRPGPDWHSPSDPISFTIEEVARYRSLAHRIVIECGKLVSSLERSLS